MANAGWLMPRTLFKKHLGKLVPAEEAAEELMSKLPHDKMVWVQVKRARNPYHHRLFFALLNKIWQNQEHYKSVDEILVAFKFAVGHTLKLKTPRGMIEYPESISFSNMDQTEFEVFYEKAMDFCVKEVIPGLDKAELTREILEMIAPANERASVL